MALSQPVHRSWVYVLALILTSAPATSADTCAYVVITGDDEVAVVDVKSQAKVADIYAGQRPVAAAIDRQGQAIYVLRMGDDAALSVLDTATYRTVKEIPLPGYYRTVVTSSDGRFAYLPDIDMGGVEVVDLSAGKLVRSIDAGKYCDASPGFALSFDGTKLFAPGCAASVEIYDTASGALTNTIPLPPDSEDDDEEALTVLLRPDEQRAYVAVWPRYQGVFVLDLTSHSVVDQFQNVGPFIMLSPDGSHLYTVEDDALDAIDVRTKAVQTIPLGTAAVSGNPILATIPESHLVWFRYLSFLVAFDAETQSVVAQIPVAGNASDVAVGNINGPCRPVNYTPPASPTPTPTATVTPTHAPTFQCPPAVPCLQISSASIPAGGESTITVHLCLEISSVSIPAGSEATITVRLMTAGQQITGVQNDISFDSHIAVHDCSSDLPLVGGFHDFGSSLRAVLDSPAGVGQTVLSDGALLYSCTVTVASDTPSGTYPLVAFNIYGSDPLGRAITVAGADGEVTVTGRDTAASSGTRGRVSVSTSSGCHIIDGPATGSLWLALAIPTLVLLRRGSPAEHRRSELYRGRGVNLRR